MNVIIVSLPSIIPILSHKASWAGHHLELEDSASYQYFLMKALHVHTITINIISL